MLLLQACFLCMCSARNDKGRTCGIILKVLIIGFFFFFWGRVSTHSISLCRRIKILINIFIYIKIEL